MGVGEFFAGLTAIVIAVFIGFVIFVLPVLAAAIKVMREYERGVVFRLGRLLKAKGPGLIILIPFIDKMVRIDLRTITMDVPPQEVITKDNVPVKVNAVVYFRVMEAVRAVVEVENFVVATSMIAQTTLRSVLGQADLDELLSKREEINRRLQKIVDDQTDPWGVKVATVELKDVELPEAMKRAMAKQAEAERERRAKVIHAEGEHQASTKLLDAARVIGDHPATLQLRFLQTLTEVAAEQNSTLVFPVPIDIIEPIYKAFKNSK